MNPFSIKKALDYIPLLIITLAALWLLWDMYDLELRLQWPHYAGLTLLPVNFYAFRLSHRLGVIVTGVVLLLGLAGIVSYAASITNTTMTWTPFGGRIPFFHGQTIFLLWLAMHIAISHKYYFAIATKKYWYDLKKEIR